jgi:hypothetical protein
MSEHRYFIDSFTPVDHLPTDTQRQFAALFGRRAPQRARRKPTLRDGGSRVSRARGG